ncbi:serine hydrolase domain-containing protein [Hymenobacter armeniacus]|uniref:Beta-lactamase family protein n=1 Tax=Hymenobacter armeniacus TaxID=2771358 RepID=A0ABR8JSC4_9BACT|nr:serine hydrolase domain-containing protein [Hymenobacter armeniacus]MBD2720839.1 beta-lactamase family protein [Hymenobacter armeniacus]
MRKLLLLASFLALATLLASTTAQAQASQTAFTSYAQFNDTLVARFNRGDFQGVEAFGSPALRQLEPLGAMAKLLAGLRAKTGRVGSSAALEARGSRHAFAWKGEKQNLRVTLVSATPGVLDDYTISDFIEQPAGARRTAPVLTDNPQKTALDQAVHRAASLYMQHPDAAGLSIAVYQGGQERFYNYGEVEKGTGRRPTPTTFYDMGSVAKTFVGTLLAQAVLDGKVKLTDDIRPYLPGPFPNLELEGQPIRFVDLANHTSGLPVKAHNYTPETKKRIDGLPLAEQMAYYNQFSADSLLLNLRTFRLDTRPGTTYRYNGVGMKLLQLLLERVYQQPYEQLVTGYVQKHFNMPDTKRVLTAKEQARFATGYAQPNRPQPHPTYTGYWAGPNLSSTPADLLKYLRANLAERDPAVRLAHQLTYRTAPGAGIGLGWMLDTDADGWARIYHNGQSPGYNTRLAFYPGQDVGFVILVNENLNQGRVTEMEELLKQQLPKPVAAPTAVSRSGSGGQ